MANYATQKNWELLQPTFVVLHNKYFGGRMARTIDVYSTDMIILGAWIEYQRLALTGTLRSANGETRPDIVAIVGEPLPTLASALKDLGQIKAKHCLVLTNSTGLQTILKHPFRLNNNPPETWPGAYFRILYELTSYCLRGTWRVQMVDDLPKARNLWQQQQPLRQTA